MENITDDVLSVLFGLPPGHLDGGGGEGLGLHVGGDTGQSVRPEHGEAGAGLCGAGSVLSNALVDGLVLLADAVDRQSAVRAERQTRTFRILVCGTKEVASPSHYCCISSASVVNNCTIC